MLTTDNKLYSGVSQMIDLQRERLNVQGYQTQLGKDVRQTVATISWMLKSRSEVGPSSKRQCVEGLITKVDTS